MSIAIVYPGLRKMERHSVPPTHPSDQGKALITLRLHTNLLIIGMCLQITDYDCIGPAGQFCHTVMQPQTILARLYNIARLVAVIRWPGIFFVVATNQNYSTLGLPFSHRNLRGTLLWLDSAGFISLASSVICMDWVARIKRGLWAKRGSSRKKIIACDALPAISVNG